MEPRQQRRRDQLQQQRQRQPQHRNESERCQSDDQSQRLQTALAAAAYSGRPLHRSELERWRSNDRLQQQQDECEPQQQQFSAMGALDTVTTFDRGNNAEWIEPGTSDSWETGTRARRFPFVLYIDSILKYLRIYHDNETLSELREQLLRTNFENDLIAVSPHLRDNFQQKLFEFVKALINYNERNRRHEPKEASRYDQDFEEVAPIGQGGFGCVFKVKHRLDDNEYAVKKICIKLNSSKVLEMYRNEVKILSKLDHDNVVRYNTSWIEYDPIELWRELPAIWNVARNESGCRSTRALMSTDDASTTSENTNDSGGIVFDENVQITEVDDEEGSAENASAFEEEVVSEVESINSKESASDESFSASEGSSLPRNSRQLFGYKAPKVQKKTMTLYIQMALCETTLAQWLEQRTEPTPEATVINILIQILQGLKYIHEQGIVHHDIKPGNIFSSTTNNPRVKLGDFGLACYPSRAEGHRFALGTPQYAAPEQLQGECNPKSDIYSVGVTLLELLVQMGMERSIIMKRLRANAEVPEELKRSYPRLAGILPRLVREKSVDRPTAAEALEMLQHNPDARIRELQLAISRLEMQIGMQSSI